MFIRRKKYLELERRVAALEWHERVNDYYFGEVTFREFLRKLPDYVQKRIDERIRLDKLPSDDFPRD